jgi:hypothetical protein
MAYETLANVKTALTIPDTDTDSDSLLTTLSEAVTAAIDQYCNRTFAFAQQARTFEAPASPHLWLPDIYNITSVTLDGVTLVAGSDYKTRPFFLGTNPHFDALVRMTGAGGAPMNWADRGVYKEIVVSGYYGYVAPPTTVIEVCRIMTVRLFNREVGKYQNDTGVSMGGLQYVSAPKCSLDKDCELMLSDLVMRTPFYNIPAWRG